MFTILGYCCILLATILMHHWGMKWWQIPILLILPTLGLKFFQWEADYQRYRYWMGK